MGPHFRHTKNQKLHGLHFWLLATAAKRFQYRFAREKSDENIIESFSSQIAFNRQQKQNEN